MINNFSKKRKFWGLLSIISPVLGFFTSFLWTKGNEEIWNTMGPKDSSAGAMMAASEVISMIILIGLASIFGMLFAAYGLRKRNRGSKISLIVGLTINEIPISFLIYIYIKSIFHGGI